jgi:RimJ/RimL family protein N-acetyltransferase
MQTAHLNLVPGTREESITQIAAMDPADRAQISADWLARLAASAPMDPWIHGFSVIHRETGVPAGSCGFKGPPTDDGTVEIAYMIHPDQRGKGYATEAAAALTSYAFTDDRVRTVLAHTLPEANASTRVLTKCGFRLVGEVIDPEDGLVWRWEKPRD